MDGTQHLAGLRRDQRLDGGPQQRLDGLLHLGQHRRVHLLAHPGLGHAQDRVQLERRRAGQIRCVDGRVHLIESIMQGAQRRGGVGEDLDRRRGQHARC